MRDSKGGKNFPEQFVHWLLFLGIFLCTGFVFGQDSISLATKSITAEQLDQIPVIDGLPDREIWDQLTLATDFIQYNPYNGRKSTFETEVRFGYNESGLYVAAFMRDPHPDSIQAQMGNRDQPDELNTDYLSIDILPYNDGLTMFEFKITPVGIQGDQKYSATGRDLSWDAVWESATSIHDSGWIAEIFIPYSALRFPRTDVQTWGINIWRMLKRKNEMSTWSYVPNDTREVFRYYGTLKGMQGVKPPLRLSFTPYLGGYLEKQPDQDRWSTYVRGGMDVKYGINQSYTLDMELIPDFGQVQSDDIILNLSPFEVRYNEHRQFFTEGTEMFEKCDIFYSRRVGTEPTGYDAAEDSLHSDEILTENPDLTQIVNATKISGRNIHGLGIGFFNGMTSNTWATATDTLNGNSRRISTQPFTNYNVLVVDQNLKNNSYVTLINTNYWTPDWKYNANVTGSETKLVNEANTFAFKGRLNVSQVYQKFHNTNLGYTALLNIYKPGGTIKYSLSSQITDKGYDPNDMGFLIRNNEIRNYGSLSHNIYNPVWKILNTSTAFEAKYFARYIPFSSMFLDVEINNSTTFRNFWKYFAEIAYRPFGNYDYYEPREDGWYYYEPPAWDGSFEVSTDSRKKLAADFETFAVYHPENKRLVYELALEPQYRISDRLTTSLSSSFLNFNNDYGWVDTEYDDLQDPTIWFGQRDIRTVSNILNIRYVFTTNISVNLRARHYWSAVEYENFYILQKDGSLEPAAWDENENIDFNAFNLDLQFRWFFAPGSEMSFVWKNNILTQGDVPADNYFQAFEETIQSPQTNSFSIRMLYYIDYLSIKRAFSGNRKDK